MYLFTQNELNMEVDIIIKILYQPAKMHNMEMIHFCPIQRRKKKRCTVWKSFVTALH